MENKEYKVNWVSTIVSNIIWSMFFTAGVITVIYVFSYLQGLEEPLRLFGTLMSIMLFLQWSRWVGMPDITFEDGLRTRYRRR